MLSVTAETEQKGATSPVYNAGAKGSLRYTGCWVSTEEKSETGSIMSVTGRARLLDRRAPSNALHDSDLGAERAGRETRMKLKLIYCAV